MERRNAMAFLYRSRRKRTGAGCKMRIAIFLMWEKQSVNV